jgi:hypothetical protein
MFKSYSDTVIRIFKENLIRYHPIMVIFELYSGYNG